VRGLPAHGRAGCSLVVLVALLGSCRPAGSPARGPESSHLPECPPELPAPPILPGEQLEHRLADYWLQRFDDAERVLMDTRTIERHNAQVLALRDGSWPNGRWSIVERAVDRSEIAKHLDERLTYLAEKISQNKAVLADGTRPDGLVAMLREKQRRATEQDELRIAWRTTPLRCFPLQQALFEPPDRRAFDLSQCSQVRFGEPVRVLMRLPGQVYVWTSYATGWLDPVALGPALDRAQAQRYLAAKGSVAIVKPRVPIWSEPRGGMLLGVAQLGASFPLLTVHDSHQGVQLLVPTRERTQGGWIRDHSTVSLGYAPFTRAALWRRAFTLLDEPYGWGGMGDKRDCSRFLMDLFGSFGLLLPRNSSLQAKAGQRQIDVEALAPAQKAQAIARAGKRRRRAALFPGHIMLYLDRDGDELYAIHQFSGYLEPCPGGGETMLRANRTAVTHLALGRGSSRRSFLERTTRLLIFGVGGNGKHPPEPNSAAQSE
jgi:hypothetical protein